MNIKKLYMFCRNFAKIDLKDTIFVKIEKGQIILFLAGCFKKGQMATLRGKGGGNQESISGFLWQEQQRTTNKTFFQQNNESPLKFLILTRANPIKQRPRYLLRTSIKIRTYIGVVILKQNEALGLFQEAIIPELHSAITVGQ